MSKSKIISLLISGLCAVLFVGLLNKSYEFYEPELCLKYPSTQFVFTKPELPDNYSDEKLNPEMEEELAKYNETYKLNEKLGFAAPVLAHVILQLFLTFLFIKRTEKYEFRFFIIDLFLFFISSLILSIGLSIALYYSQNLVGGAIIFVFNFLINYKLRNFIFSKVV